MSAVSLVLFPSCLHLHAQMRSRLHDLAVRLRAIFVREDATLSGTIPRHVLPHCLRAAGFDLTPLEVRECQQLFQSTNGRFDWQRFCDDISRERSIAWSRLKRVPFEATAPSQDNLGYVSPQELASTTARWRCAHASSAEHTASLFQPSLYSP